ncbi:MAG TPA: PEPxxWA-CTERM sorting domain-containing protein, partial [Caulobacteraceae bacterium]|nr:PEPxxWA-CTERM sorting domain-containing protein [Caulobacteraceae bacterium]
ALVALVGALSLVGSVSAARAGTTTIDLSTYVNEGFTNSWFINGGEFAPIVGTTTGNQGTGIPFNVANPSDGLGGNNNFWFGLYSGPGTLFGPPGSVKIPISTPNVTKVYTLTDNTFGNESATEFSVTFNGTGGSITDNYVGGVNTKDYNLNCGTTGCDTTPNAQYWFVDQDGSQWLQVQQWTLPNGFGLQSVEFDQVNGSDGAILAGLTVAGGVPEPATWAMILLGVGLVGAGMRVARHKTSAALGAQ